MTDEESYELLIKYCGGETGLIKVRQMIHTVGIEGTINLVLESYEEQGKVVPEEFQDWMRQSYTYLSNLMSQPHN